MYALRKRKQFSPPASDPIVYSQHQLGVTLLEVVVAGTILVIGLLSFLAVFLNCMRLDSVTKERVLAVNHARLRMESLRAMPFDAIEDANGETFDVPDLAKIAPDIPIGTITVDNSSTIFLDVTVSLQWASQSGNSQIALQARFTPIEASD